MRQTQRMPVELKEVMRSRMSTTLVLDQKRKILLSRSLQGY
jgi:hypothetical protein